MPLADYSELVAEIRSRTHRNNLDAQIPTSIWMAEARLGRKLALLDWEAQIPLLTADNVATMMIVVRILMPAIAGQATSG